MALRENITRCPLAPIIFGGDSAHVVWFGAKGVGMTIDGAWIKTAATQAVFSALESAGYEAFFVGGCVRNALMGFAVDDLDIATNAKPQAIITSCKNRGLKCIPTGIDHGTITVISDGIAHEITTYRRDVQGDGRHAIVEFSTQMQEDAARRDFTINALYADRHGKIYDPLGAGKDDLPENGSRSSAARMNA